MTAAFNIEKGVPLPPIPEAWKQYRGGGRQKVYPWEQFQVGDSALIPSINVYTVGKAWASRRGIQFACRKTKQGFRMWRVA